MNLEFRMGSFCVKSKCHQYELSPRFEQFSLEIRTDTNSKQTEEIWIEDTLLKSKLNRIEVETYFFLEEVVRMHLRSECITLSLDHGPQNSPTRSFPRQTITPETAFVLLQGYCL